MKMIRSENRPQLLSLLGIVFPDPVIPDQELDYYRYGRLLVNDMKSESVLPFEWNHCPQLWKSWAGQQANSLRKWLDEDRFCKFQQGTLALFTPVPLRTSIYKRVLPLECSDASHISGQKFHRKGKSDLHFGSLTIYKYGFAHNWNRKSE
jgi:hypothetical protein